MNWRTFFLLTVSILGTVSLSCHGPDTGAAGPTIAAELNTSSPAQGFLDTEIPKAESQARAPELNHEQESRDDKTRYEKELIMLAGLAASFL